MNALEEQLSALLKEAPGEPPVTVDADALLARGGPRRRRFLAPALAAAAVVAIAVGVGVGVGVTLRSTDEASNGPSPSSVRPPSYLKPQVIRAVDSAIRNAPTLPGAHEVHHSIAGLKASATITTSPNQVDRKRWWTAPGTVQDALDFLKAHRPSGMTLGGIGRGWFGQQIETINFGGAARLSLSYSITPFRGGVAVGADASSIWVPDRPPWSYVPDSVTSVDVTVVRSSPQPNPKGAPTVRRTLTGDSARALAVALNRLSESPPMGTHGCPMMFVGKWEDILVFRAVSTTVRVVQTVTGCWGLAVSDGVHRYIALDGSIDHVVLAALGLPDDYGFR